MKRQWHEKFLEDAAFQHNPLRTLVDFMKKKTRKNMQKTIQTGVSLAMFLRLDTILLPSSHRIHSSEPSEGYLGILS